jgi:hypothetical protein
MGCEVRPITALINRMRRKPGAAPAPQEASVKAPATTTPIDRHAAGISPKEPSAMILVAPASPHTYMNTTLAERDRVSAAFDDEQVNRAASRLFHQVKLNLESGGTRGLVAAAIRLAAAGATSDGQVQGESSVTPADVVRALEVLLRAAEDEHEAERARAAKHREAQNAARTEWDELASAVRERQNSAAAELAHIAEQQRVQRSGGGIPADQRFELQMHALRASGLDEMEARELLQKATGAKKAEPPMGRDELNARASALNARLTRYRLFSNDRRANFWLLYDIDSTLDVLLEDTAKRLGIPVPDTPIEVPAA